MMISPSGKPCSASSDASAWRAMATRFSTASLCSSTGAVSYQANGARTMPPHFSRTTASRRSRTSSAPSAAISSTPHCRFTTWPSHGCPVLKAAARSRKVKVFPAPHWPGHQAVANLRNQAFDQPRLERPRVGIAVSVKPRQVRIMLLFVVEVIVFLAKIIICFIETRVDRLGFLLGRLLLRFRRCLGFPAIEQRQLRLPELLGAAFNLTTQTIFGEITAPNALWVFLQVFEDAIHIPSTAHVVADDRVKHIRSICACRCAFTHDLLNDVDAVPASAAVKSITFARRSLFCCCSFASLAPHKSPIKYLIDVAELPDCRIKRVAGDRQCLVGFAEQLSRNILPFNLQCEFAIERIAVSEAPDAYAFTARRHFLIGTNRDLQVILRPNVDRVCDGATAMIKINRSKRIVVSQDIADAISVPSLHSC